MSVKVSDVVGTVSARACVLVCGEGGGGGGGGGGGNNPKKSLFDIRCHQHGSNKWQYLHTVYLLCERAKSI